MSQNDILQHVGRWSAEDCHEKLLETVSGLLVCVGEQDYHTSQHDTLKALFETCLSYLPIEDLETKLFHQLMPKLEFAFSSLLADIKTQISRADGDITTTQVAIVDILQLSCLILECVEFCLSHVSSMSSIAAAYIYSIPSSTLNIIQDSYNHCKESPIIYGDLLEASNEPLTDLFQKTGSLLMVFISAVEKLTISGHVADDVLLISTILDGLRKISQIVCELDVKIMALLWKTYVRMAVQYVDDIKAQLDVASAIRALSKQIAKDLESIASKTAARCSGSDVEKFVIKLLRISGFNMKILVMLCDKYAGYLGDCDGDIVELIFTLYKNFPPSALAPKLSQTLFDEMECQLIIGIDPLLNHLVGDRGFVACLTSKAEVHSEKEPFFFSLLITYILEKIPRLEEAEYDTWVAEGSLKTSIIEKLFKCLPACHVELMTPVRVSGIMCQGKPQRMVSFYEHLCTRLCGFVACFPAKHFAKLERVLLQNLLSSFHWCQLLAADVWAFLARVGSAELCWQHCCLLADLVVKCEGVKNSSTVFIANLLNRMLHFLAADHLELFILKYSVKESPWIWSALAITRQSCPSLQNQTQQAAADGIARVQTLLEMPSNGTFAELELAVSLITRGVKVASALKAEDLISQEIQAVCSSLWKTALFEDSLIVEHTIPVVLKIILLTAEVLSQCDSATVLEALTYLRPLLLTRDDAISVGVIICLLKLAKKFFPPSPEQTNILFLLPDLFGELLEDSNWLVYTSSLDTFCHFAHETNHTEVIPVCLQMKHNLQETISNYLNKIPFDGSFSAGNLAEFLNEEQQLLRMGRSQSNNDDLVQKPAKRLRSDIYDDFLSDENVDVPSHIDDCLSTMQTSMYNLKELVKAHGLHRINAQQLEKIRTDISELLTEYG